MENRLPIGIFDSGLGGLTVMQECIRELPHENILYLADTLHLPYGEKSPEEILRYTQEGAERLLKLGIKLLFIACHTASCHALETLQKTLPIPVLGTIDPTLSAIPSNLASLAILGTESTIRSKVYQNILQKTHPQIRLFPIPCPRFASLIEEAPMREEALFQEAKRYLQSLEPAALLLACTHYPLIRPILEKVSPNTPIIDPSLLCARAVKQRLFLSGLFNPQKTIPSYVLFATSEEELFLKKARNLFPKQDLIKNKIS